MARTYSKTLDGSIVMHSLVSDRPQQLHLGVEADKAEVEHALVERKLNAMMDDVEAGIVTIDMCRRIRVGGHVVQVTGISMVGGKVTLLVKDVAQ